MAEERSNTLEARTQRREEYRRQAGGKGFFQDLFYIGSDRSFESGQESEGSQEAEAARELGKTSTAGLEFLKGPLIGGALALVLVGGKVWAEKGAVKLKAVGKKQFRGIPGEFKGIWGAGLKVAA